MHRLGGGPGQLAAGESCYATRDLAEGCLSTDAPEPRTVHKKSVGK